MELDGPIRAAVRRVHRGLRAEGATLGVAESCTGGLVGAALTAEPGASDVFELGVVAYADGAKRAVLEVPAATIHLTGAVSGPTARAMAVGAVRAAEADWGLSITGIAGPGGGRPGKPVGTVYVGVARVERDGIRSRARRFRFDGDRAAVRRQTTRTALERLADVLDRST